MRDPTTDAPVGIHRIGLALKDGEVVKLDRMALGRMGVVKLWPMNGGEQLVVGEGIETTLAAATRISYHDMNGEGQKAADCCRQIWCAHGRSVALLVPKQAGWDFNDVILGRPA